MTLDVTYEALIPNVNVMDESQLLDLGEVTIGSTETRPLRFVNKSDIEASLIADLSNFEEFSLLVFSSAIEHLTKEDCSDSSDKSSQGRKSSIHPSEGRTHTVVHNEIIHERLLLPLTSTSLDLEEGINSDYKRG